MDTTVSPSSDSTAKQTYIVVGVVAAALSAATAGYFFYQRSRKLAPKLETVQNLLDRCHDQVLTIEKRLGDFASNAISTVS